MQIVKVLNRRDAYSVLLAIVLAMSIQGLMSVAYFWASSLLASSGEEFGPTNTWNQVYGPSLISGLIQLVAVEVFLWVVMLLKRVNRPVRRAKK